MALALACTAAAAAKPKNVLFLIADDLRPQLNKAYGKRFMHTPNIDKFTDSALVFDWAYTNFAICSASRNSFLSGRVPDKTRTWNFIVRTAQPAATISASTLTSSVARTISASRGRTG
jgi:arylsulfatase A-like enzyme